MGLTEHIQPLNSEIPINGGEGDSEFPEKPRYGSLKFFFFLGDEFHVPYLCTLWVSPCIPYCSNRSNR